MASKLKAEGGNDVTMKVISAVILAVSMTAGCDDCYTDGKWYAVGETWEVECGFCSCEPEGAMCMWDMCQPGPRDLSMPDFPHGCSDTPIPTPTLDPQPMIWTKNPITFTGNAPKAATIIVTGGVGFAMAPVAADGTFSVAVKLTVGKTTTLFFQSLDEFGCPSARLAIQVSVVRKKPLDAGSGLDAAQDSTSVVPAPKDLQQSDHTSPADSPWPAS